LPKSVSIYEIKEVIGEETVLKMIEQFPCSQLYIPNKIPEFPDLDKRNQYIKNLYFSSGKSINEIAAKVDLSTDRVRKIVSQR
jgi:DNA-binding NarL/FixJ family response regulator